MVSRWFVAFMDILIVVTCGMLIPEELASVWRGAKAWKVVLSKHPRSALRAVWLGFWNSWLAVGTVATIMYGFASQPSFTGYGLAKWLFISANTLLFVRCCIAEELHGAKDSRKAHGERLSIIVIVLVVLGGVSFIECGMVGNAERGTPPTLHNIWNASLWWRPIASSNVSTASTPSPAASKAPTEAAQSPGVKHNKSRRSGPDTSQFSDVEPAERALIRVAIKASAIGQIFKATIYAQNVGKYSVLPPAFVRVAVQESPPLSDENTLFDGAPFVPHPKKSAKRVIGPNDPNWQGSGITSLFSPWYPGDVKSVNVEGPIPEPTGTQTMQDKLNALASGDEGWYVLTRALFFDKLGSIPYRDSCTYYSVKYPNGFPCLTHND